MGAYYEFFAGGGMARAGLGANWTCLFSNELDRKKAACYAQNWGDGCLRLCDVASLTPADLPGRADLCWASFPCQDLSLAGIGAGLGGGRSGTFWPFSRLIGGLKAESRAPRLIVLENVCGALTSHGGKDFDAIAAALSKLGYRFGAVVIDAVHFVPQSRPRLFIIGLHRSAPMPPDLMTSSPAPEWAPPALVQASSRLTGASRDAWVWWRLPPAPLRNADLEDLVEDDPQDVTWHSPDETAKLLAMMTAVNQAKVANARMTGRRVVGTVYKRTRTDRHGVKAQRAEVRFDGVAGCLRTPAGGSSRQTVMLIDGDETRSRLLSPREGARLMGLPDDYRLPGRYNDAYHLVGDGVAVPVVRFLARSLLEPLLAGASDRQAP